MRTNPHHLPHPISLARSQKHQSVHPQSQASQLQPHSKPCSALATQPPASTQTATATATKKEPEPTSDDPSWDACFQEAGLGMAGWESGKSRMGTSHTLTRDRTDCVFPETCSWPVEWTRSWLDATTRFCLWFWCEPLGLRDIRERKRRKKSW